MSKHSFEGKTAVFVYRYLIKVKGLTKTVFRLDLSYLESHNRFYMSIKVKLYNSDSGMNT